MREIGGEFWDVPTTSHINSIFSSDTEWFLSGRSALKAIISDIKAKHEVHTATLPSWCCDSMITPFLDAGISVQFYTVFKIIEGLNTDIILVMDYFGFTGHSELCNYKGIIIRDVTHSIFSSTYNDADYYFGSLRKWAGFWTGGYAWGARNTTNEKSLKYVELRRIAMLEKRDYIFRTDSSKEYLNIFREAEHQLDKCSIALAAERDIKLARTLDISYLREQRRKNAKILLSAFSDIAIFPVLCETDCPLFVPIRVSGSDRNKLQKFLIQEEIYCPIHWPLSSFHYLNDFDKKIYNEEISLVCDQRYSEDDMYRIVYTIHKYFQM